MMLKQIFKFTQRNLASPKAISNIQRNNYYIIHSDKKWSEMDEDPIVFDYKDLLDPFERNEKAIRMTFGPYSAGTCLVQYLQHKQKNFTTLIQGTSLDICCQLAYLPPDILNSLVHEDQQKNIGWSFPKGEGYQGKQQQHHSMQGENEGTFSAQIKMIQKLNREIPSEQYELQQNLWPSMLPEFKEAFQELVTILIDVSKLLAQHIDKYIEGITFTYQKGQLQKIVEQGHHYGTLYHYYNQDDQSIDDLSEDQMASWGKWHNDFNAITAICPALYSDAKQKSLKFYDRKGGLHYRNRYGNANKIHAPKDSVIFIVGEALQILSGGVLEAIPHCVRKSSLIKELKLSRTSFSLNMQPKKDYKLSVPDLIHPEMISNHQQEKIPPLKERWVNGMPYDDFVKKSQEKYKEYEQNGNNNNHHKNQ